MTVEISRLPNGLTIASERMQSVESVTAGLWLKTGARNERIEEHGIAHLLEHMAFKGTRRRTARQIADEIENVGGEINAATSVETTAYYARVLKEDLPLAVDLIGDILCNSLFDDEELQREKHVIVQELGAAEDTPDDIVFDRFTETAYRHQAIGRSILGTRDTLKQFGSNDIRRFMDREYRPGQMVFIAVGNVDHKALVRHVEAAFGHLSADPKPTGANAATYVGGEYRERRPLSDAQIVLGFEGEHYLSDNYFAAQVLSAVLGGGMSSRLFQEIRENRGLCYSIYAFHWAFADTGLFAVHAATEEADLAELGPVILEEMDKATGQIEKLEIDRACAQFRASLLMARESTGARANQIARQLLLFERIIGDDEILTKLREQTPGALQTLARSIFSRPPSLAAIGPVDTFMTMSDVAQRLGTHGETAPAARLADR